MVTGTEGTLVRHPLPCKRGAEGSAVRRRVKAPPGTRSRRCACTHDPPRFGALLQIRNEFLCCRRAAPSEAYHLRTSDQRELDLVLEFGRQCWAIEVKLTSSPSPQTMRRLDDTADLIGATRRFLICRVARPMESASHVRGDLDTFLKHLPIV